jgi:hypothetical protein
MEFIYGLMAENIEVILYRILDREKDNYYGQMEKYMMGNGLMENSMERDNLLCQIRLVGWLYGIMAKK